MLGRFIQPDSIIADVYSSQSLNLYSYVINNPLRYVDPAGYAPEDPNAPESLDTAYDGKLSEKDRQNLESSTVEDVDPVLDRGNADITVYTDWGVESGTVVGNSQDIQPTSALQIFLHRYSNQAGIAGTAALFIPGGQPASGVLLTTATLAKGLEVSLYSKDKKVDTIKEIVKMVVPIEKPYDMLSDEVIDSIADTARERREKYRKEGHE